MIQFCLGVWLGFAIAAVVYAGKREDKDMGWDE